RISTIRSGSTTGPISKMRGGCPVEFDRGARQDCSTRRRRPPGRHCESNEKRLKCANPSYASSERGTSGLRHGKPDEERLKFASLSHASWERGTSGPRSTGLDWRS